MGKQGAPSKAPSHFCAAHPRASDPKQLHQHQLSTGIPGFHSQHIKTRHWVIMEITGCIFRPLGQGTMYFAFLGMPFLAALCHRVEPRYNPGASFQWGMVTSDPNEHGWGWAPVVGPSQVA